MATEEKSIIARSGTRAELSAANQLKPGQAGFCTDEKTIVYRRRNTEATRPGEIDLFELKATAAEAIATFDRSLASQQTSISGGIQGTLSLTVNAPLIDVTISKMGTIITQGYSGARGRLALYSKPLGETTFTKIAETGEIDFSSVGWKEAPLVGGEITIAKNTQLFLGICSIGNPNLLTYSGYNANPPNQISHLLSNVWTQPVASPAPILPASFSGGSSSGTRFFVVAFK